MLQYLRKTTRVMAVAAGLMLFGWVGWPGPTAAAAGTCPDPDLQAAQSLCVEGDTTISPPLRAYAWPDLETLPPFDLRVIVSGQKKILRFSNSVWNRGEGVFELRGDFDQCRNRLNVVQLLFGPDGRTYEHGVGTFVFHREHNHWHWPGFSIYEIWSTNPEGRPEAVVITSGKVGYCMLDIERVKPGKVEAASLEGVEAPDVQQYRQCGWRRQGISSGWADVYHSGLPGQDLDISSLPNGLYLLRSTVDPQNLLVELRDENNTASIYFSLRGDRIRVLDEEVVNYRPSFIQ